jgi:hypothetical protein
MPLTMRTFILALAIVACLDAAAETRLQYLIRPIRGVAAADAQAARVTAIVRGDQFALIVAFRNGTWLKYVVRSDGARCTTHEEFTLSTTPSQLAVDSAPPVCTQTPVTVTAGGKQFTVAVDDWKTHGADAVVAAAGSDFAKVFRGPVAALAQVNHYVAILCGRMSALYGLACEASELTPKAYRVDRLRVVDCLFDGLHGEPCPAAR